MVGYYLDQSQQHKYCINTYLLCDAECDCLLRFTIFIELIIFLNTFILASGYS